MTYVVVVVNHDEEERIKRAIKHANRQLEHVEIKSLWKRDLGHHQTEYSAHIKTGHLGNHHHYSVVWIVKHEHHQEHIESVFIEEGHKTFF